MRELMAAELRRLRLIVAAGGAAHLIVLALFTRMVDLLQQPLVVYQLFAGVYVAVALVLGVWQLRAHRRPNAWFYLLHRPVSPRRIAAAVLGAGALACGLMIAVPIAVLVLAQAVWSPRVVDLRHLGLPAAAALLACAGQLAGALLVIHPARHALAALALLAWLAVAHAAGPWALVVELVAVSWLAILAVAAFCPDPGPPPRSPLVLALLALPVASALAAVLPTAASLAFQLGWIVAGTHPLNGPAPAGGYVEASRAGAHALLGRAPAELRGEPITLAAELDRLPRRHELTNVAPMEFDDGGTRWVFSHDTMQFVAIDLATLERRGSLGRHGAGAFGVPPLVGDGALLDAHTLYVRDRATGRVIPRVALPAGETMAAWPRPLGRALVVLSDRAITLYTCSDPSRRPVRCWRGPPGDSGAAAPEVRDAQVAETVLHRVPLPLPIGALERVDLAEAGDGYAVSIVGGLGSLDGRGAGRHWRLRAGPDGVQLLADRPLAHDFPELLRHRDLVASPILWWIRERAIALLADPAPLRAVPPPAPGRISMLVIAVLALTAALWAERRSRRLELPRGRALAWTLASLVFGWPMAIAFRLIERRP